MNILKEQANFRIDSDVKARAYYIFEQMGLKPTDAVNMFMRHVAMHGELPFQPRVPNHVTLQAMDDAQNKRNLTDIPDIDSLF